MTIKSLGFVEVRGFVSAIAVADAMIKSSNVRILMETKLDPGQITVIVEGDLGACEAAVAAGATVARSFGTLVGVLLKGKPDPSIEDWVQHEAPPADAGNPKESSSGELPEAAVLAFIGQAETGRTTVELTKAFNVNAKTVRAWVKFLECAGKIERFNRGVRLSPKRH